MVRVAVLTALLVLLAGCGGSPPPTTQGIFDQFKAAGLEAENPHASIFQEGSPFPRSFTDALTFDLPSLGNNKHGGIFVCDTKKNCDAIYAYLDAVKGLLGPYYYQSTSGTAVVALDSAMPPATAAKYEAIVKGLP